jgi:WS/DGAT/MGAT family acyltransferase
MKQLSGQDNSFLEIEGIGLPQHISSVAIYDQSTAPGGSVRFKDILSHLKSRLHLSPIFTSKLHQVPMGVDRPYLVDDPDLDLEYHVRHIALPQPGDWRQLCISLARINARPLDMSRPLWEMYVIEGLDNIDNVPKGSFALLIRIHHCVMDGASGVAMMSAIHDLGPKPRKLKPEQVRIIELPQSDAVLLGRAYVNALRKPRRFYQLGKKMMGQQRQSRRMPSTERTEGAKRQVETRFNREISAHRVLDSISLDFAEVRAIKNGLEGATINDVMLTVVTGALHKYLKAEGELPDEPLTCGCPIDVRDKNEKDTGGNVIGFMGVNLHTQIEDPLERFQAIHDSANKAKAHAQASDVRINKEIMDTVPGGLMTAAMRVTAAMGVNTTPFNTMLTNVPGPPNQLYFAGAQIVEGFGIGPLVPNVGLFHTASSSVMNKEGKINFSFWACREALPNPDFYRQCIEESYAELKAATVPTRAKKSKPRAKTKAQTKAKTAAKTKAKARAKAKAKPANKRKTTRA